MAKTKYGMTWWGEQWLCALKGIDYANRIPRGASYARKGMVKSIDIVDNVVRCKVAGSRRLPYKVDFVVRKFTAEQIDKLVVIC